MAEAITIARPYADAAFKLARDKSRLSAWAEMLELLEAVAQDTRIKVRIGDPNVSAEQLHGLILVVCGDRLDGDAKNFVKVLADSGRTGFLPEIRVLFDQLKAGHEGLLKVRIVSAFKLTDVQHEQLVARLETKHKRKVSATVEVDESLIGGVRLEVGDQVMDASVRGRLDAMAQALTR